MKVRPILTMREVFNLFSFDSVLQFKRSCYLKPLSLKSCDSYSIIRSINSTYINEVKIIRQVPSFYFKWRDRFCIQDTL